MQILPKCETGMERSWAMIIGLYDTSYMYDIIRTFGDIELPSGSSLNEILNKKGIEKCIQ